MLRKDANVSFEIHSLNPQLFHDKTSLKAVRDAIDTHFQAVNNGEIVYKREFLKMVDAMLAAPTTVNHGNVYKRKGGSHLVDSTTPEEVEVLWEHKWDPTQSPTMYYRDTATGDLYNDSQIKFFGKFG